MKVVQEYWECDVCKNRFDTEKKLRKVKIPSKNYDCEGKTWGKSLAEVDMCDDCFRTFWEICNREFATVEDFYGIKVYPHTETAIVTGERK